MSDRAYIPPQNLEAEKAVLGGVLQDNQADTRAAGTAQT